MILSSRCNEVVIHWRDGHCCDCANMTHEPGHEFKTLCVPHRQGAVSANRRKLSRVPWCKADTGNALVMSEPLS